MKNNDQQFKKKIDKSRVKKYVYNCEKKIELGNTIQIQEMNNEQKKISSNSRTM